MKILVTGSSGFIGSHLTEYLVNKGYKVVAFDRYNSNNDYRWLENSKFKKINFILGDIRDYDSVFKAMKGCRCDASSCSNRNSLLLLFTNSLRQNKYWGYTQCVRSCKKFKIKTSCDYIYKWSLWFCKQKKLNESDELKAQSPYATSKISADQLSLSFFRSFGLPVKIIRPFNTFGPRQSARAVIPTILAQAVTQKILKLGI